MKDFLPISYEEIKQRKWEHVDVVLITPDAYVDHPSFAMAVIGRVIESLGLRVAILSQPNWRDINDFKKFGKPRICFAVSGGNMDSMINKYTHNKKLRQEDEYSPGGRVGLRPDRATIVYSNMAKAAYPDVPVIIGGIEATMRRFVHYDWWQDKIRKPILLDSKADILVYGMGEKTIKEILIGLISGKKITELRNIRGTGFFLKEKEIPHYKEDDVIELPSFEEILKNKELFCEMTEIIYKNLNPFIAKKLMQRADTRAVLLNPPQLPLTQEELDWIYELPYTYQPHPSYKEKIPAFETIKNSIIIHRGCFGGCSFCSLYLHQGKFIQSRSLNSIINEIERRAKGSKITITDIGGPSANMYMMSGKDFEKCKNCNRISCLHPKICENLNTSHESLIKLMKVIRNHKNVKNLFVSSGIRIDLALLDKNYLKDVIQNHTSGQIKVAPEHTQIKVLNIMNKPSFNTFEKFIEIFEKFSKEAKKEQYIIPYFISAFPGTTLDEAIEMGITLKQKGIKALQINDFLPAPGEYATAIYYTGMDPITKEKIYIPKSEIERKMHRALIQYFKKENIPLIFKALKITRKLNLFKHFTKH